MRTSCHTMVVGPLVKWPCQWSGTCHCDMFHSPLVMRHPCQSCWLCSVKGTVTIKLNGVVVIMFCLHEWAWWVCWFDSAVVQYIFSSTTLALQHWTWSLCQFPSNAMYWKLFTIFLQPVHTILEVEHTAWFPLVHWFQCWPTGPSSPRCSHGSWPVIFETLLLHMFGQVWQEVTTSKNTGKLKYLVSYQKKKILGTGIV